MPCFHPLKGYHARSGTGIAFNRKLGWEDRPMSVPCGQCIGCRLERTRQWAIRCLHESELHEQNSFLTLTYNDEHLPTGATLVKRDFQTFMKRLRKELHPKKIRFYHCGEYGDKNRRPHYHALIFGHSFPDRQIFKLGKDPLYTSQQLEKCWTAGFSTVGNLTFESAAYTARYIMKKINGQMAEDHYWNHDKTTGEAFKIIPEYTTMSRRPGIGGDWFKLYKHDCYPKDYIHVRGKKMKPPKFYDKQYEHDYPDEMAKIKAERLANRPPPLSEERLATMKTVLKAKLAQHSRKL